MENRAKPSRTCGTPGCELPDFHPGLRSSQRADGPRQRSCPAKHMVDTQHASRPPPKGKVDKTPSQPTGDEKLRFCKMNATGYLGVFH
eukprot:5305752-Prymnesium_polylepis.1